MSEPSDLYTYTKGDLFERPNTYMYPPIHGIEFLDAYKKNRKSVIDALLANGKNWSAEEKAATKKLLERYKGAKPRAGFLNILEGSETVGSNYWNRNATVLEEALKKGEGETPALLDALLTLRESGRSQASSEYSLVLKQLQRNFEVRRVLFQRYEKNLKKGIEISKDPGIYARLACLTALELNSPSYLQVTNVLLKLNDSVVFSFTGLTKVDQLLGALSLSLELSHIDSLMKQKGVE